MNNDWKGMYRISGITTIVLTVFFFFDTIIWIILGPYPNSAENWFTLLQTKRTIGLLLLSFPTFLGIVLYFLTFIVLYHVLRPVNPAYTAVAAVFAFVGLTIIIMAYAAYPIVFLSEQYSITSQTAEKASLLLSGEMKLSASSIGLNIGGFFVEGSAFVFSILMLRSNIFTKKIAYLGILGHGLDFIRISMNLAFIPEKIGAILLMVGGLPQMIWLISIGVKFYQLGQSRDNFNQDKLVLFSL